MSNAKTTTTPGKTWDHGSYLIWVALAGLFILPGLDLGRMFPVVCFLGWLWLVWLIGRRQRERINLLDDQIDRTQQAWGEINKLKRACIEASLPAVGARLRGKTGQQLDAFATYDDLDIVRERLEKLYQSMEVRVVDVETRLLQIRDRHAHDGALFQSSSIYPDDSTAQPLYPMPTNGTARLLPIPVPAAATKTRTDRTQQTRRVINKLKRACIDIDTKTAVQRSRDVPPPTPAVASGMSDADALWLNMNPGDEHKPLLSRMVEYKTKTTEDVAVSADDMPLLEDITKESKKREIGDQ
jgi:hypothetical protein